MINMIYASKLYRSSTRKDKIHAAFNNTANSELVTQLVSYLDPKYQKYSKPEQEKPEASEAEDGEPSEDKEVNYTVPDSLSSGLDDDFNPSDHFYTVDDSDEALLSDEDTSEPSPSDSESSEESPAAEPVEESTSIHACTDIVSEVDVIKGTLNSREDTAGVSRIQLKDNEMWVYYKDDVNLNNIMTNVIEFFNASGRTYLEFNRLARSDNAIVFVMNSVQENIKPIQQVEGDKK